MNPWCSKCETREQGFLTRLVHKAEAETRTKHEYEYAVDAAHDYCQL